MSGSVEGLAAQQALAVLLFELLMMNFGLQQLVKLGSCDGEIAFPCDVSSASTLGIAAQPAGLATLPPTFGMNSIDLRPEQAFEPPVRFPRWSQVEVNPKFSQHPLFACRLTGALAPSVMWPFANVTGFRFLSSSKTPGARRA
jgi:hypothetical protein